MEINQDTPEGSNAQDELTALIFKQEQKMEIWTTENPKIVVERKKLDKEILSLPIGKFRPKDIDNQLIKKLNLSESDQLKIVKFLIFPNDSRISGTFTPCFACPHSVAETYATLEVLIRNFPIKNNSR